jgi:hypothetical protein
MDMDLPLGLVLFDCALGAMMWVLVGRFAVAIFLPDNSPLFLMRWIVRVTDPIFRSTIAITPSFLTERLKPLYIAWLLLILRFYALPLLLDYTTTDILSLPLEGGIARLIESFGQIFSLNI